jgi:hypothetical protein
MSAKQQCFHRSKTCCQTLKHFDNVISTSCENVYGSMKREEMALIPLTRGRQLAIILLSHCILNWP